MITVLVFSGTAARSSGDEAAEDRKEEEQPQAERAGYDLERCIDLALENEPRVRAEMIGEEVALNMVSLAKANVYSPRIELRSFVGPSPEARCKGYGVVDGKCIPERAELADLAETRSGLSAFTRTEVDLYQPIYAFGKFDALISAAEHALDAQRANLKTRRNETTLAVNRLYYGLLFGGDVLRLVERVEKKLDEAEKKVEEKLRKGEGNVTNVDLYKLRVFRGELVKRKFEAEAGESSARAAMKVVIGLGEADEFEAADGKLQPVEWTPAEMEKYVAGALASRPEIKAADEVSNAKGDLLKSAKADYFPQVFVAGTFRYAYAPNRDDPHDPFVSDYMNTLSLGAAAGIRQSLNFLVTKQGVDKADAEYRQAAGIGVVARKAVEAQVKKAFFDAKRAADSLGSAKDARKAGKAWFTSATMDFSVGLADVKDLVDAYGSYVKSDTEYLKSVYELDIAVAELMLVSGVKTSEEERK